MGTFAFLNFLIIFSLILNAFSDANRHRCGCGCRHKRCCDDSSSSEEPCGCAERIKQKTTAAHIHTELICISTYDAILIVANINKLIHDFQSYQDGIEITFSPMFEIVNVDGCFQLKLNTTYTNIFGAPVQEFLKNDVIAKINPLLESDGTTNSCPDEKNAKLLIGINFCAIGTSFVDQLNKIPEILNNILIKNAIKQLSQVRMELKGYYHDKLYATLVANGYEKQLKESIILKKIASGAFTVILCKETSFISITVAATKPEFIYSTTESIKRATTALTNIGEMSTTIETTLKHAPEKSTKPQPLMTGTTPSMFNPTTSTPIQMSTTTPTTTTSTRTTPSIMSTPSISIELNEAKNLTWSTYSQILNKNYTSLDTVIDRAANFAKSQQMIQEHNAAFDAGETSYTLQYTPLSDLSPKEVPRGKGVGRAPVRPPINVRRNPVSATTLPKTVDWRTQGAVTPVKDQGTCGSCYTFSSTVVLEALRFFKTGKTNLTDLSEQQLVDCTQDPPFYNGGCYYGWVESVFDYLLTTPKHGSMTEYSYIYSGTDSGSCKYTATKTVLNITAYGYASCDWSGCPGPYLSESKMREYLVIAPITVNIYSSCDDFVNYGSGIYDKTCCLGITSDRTDHTIALVGYVTGSPDGDYWIGKNSWGHQWGENGYVRMRMNKNMCGLATTSIFAR